MILYRSGAPYLMSVVRAAVAKPGRDRITRYDDPSVGEEIIVNQVLSQYNDFGQLTDQYQAHGGAVNVSTTPNVEYGYADGATNTVRPTLLTYPSGRVLSYDYGTSDGIDDASSRIASLVDDDMSETHLADYAYLGRRSFVEVDYAQPEVKWTLIGTAGGDDPDTGDIYRGLDRFGRVKDSYWYDYGSSSAVDRIKYGYDRNGNRTYRENVVATALNKNFDELYLNDLINRLAQMDRGRLNGGKDGVTNLEFAQCWSLDETGNWKDFREDDDGSGWSLEQQRTANEANEITGISETTGPSWATPAYDPAGNMTTMPKPVDPTATYAATFDAWNRLVKLEDGEDTVAEYQYDGRKYRTVAKNYAGGVLDETRHFYYTKEWQVIEERVGASSDPDRQFVWGLRYIDDCVLRDRDEERLYALQDANWNVTALVDANGDVQERFAYSPYGVPIFLSAAFVPQGSSASAWETLYAGYRYDAMSGLFCVRNRYLHPVLSMWVSRDPIGFQSGFNLYEYANGQPLIYSDPEGLFICWLLGHECIGELITCLCDLASAIETILNPRRFPNLVFAATIIDCACDFLTGAALDCKCKNPNISTWQLLISIADCALSVALSDPEGKGNGRPNYGAQSAINIIFEILEGINKSGELPPFLTSCATMFRTCFRWVSSLLG